MIDFHLLFHCGLHFDHFVEHVLKELTFSLLPSKVIEVVGTGLIVIDWDLFCKLTSTSANLLIGSWGTSGASGSCTGKVVSRETL